jgi:outer membrane protein assembly factor BamB
MIATGPALGAQRPLPTRRTMRSTLVVVAAAVTLAACSRDSWILDPSEAVVRPFDGVVARIAISNPTQITVLGSTERLGAAAFASNGAQLCAGVWLGCAPGLFTRPFQWKMDVTDVVSFESSDATLLNASVRLVALAEGRVKLTASLDGHEATTFVDVVERARRQWSVLALGATKGIAIGEDGTIYAASSGGLQALGPEGEVRWAVRSDCCVRGIPAIAGDGTLYLPSDRGLTAIDPSGSVRWASPLEDARGAPAIGPDGTIYQVTYHGMLYAVDPSGRIKWRFEVDRGDRFQRGSPAIAEDGTIYFASEDHNLYAIDPSGRELWRFPTAGPVRPASIGADGTIYFANDRAMVGGGRDWVVVSDSRMYAVNPDGTERWSMELDDDVWAAPAIGFDGTLYMGTEHWIYEITPDGSVLSKRYGGSIHTPIVAGDGSIYTTGGPITAVDARGTLKWQFRPGNFAGPQPAIGLDGTIYASAHDGAVNHVHAFTELAGTNGGYDRAPWPQERGDRANTGRARSRP